MVILLGKLPQLLLPVLTHKDLLQVLGEHLPELDSVLVEAVDAPEEALDGGPVLVESEDLPDAEYVVLFEEDGD